MIEILKVVNKLSNIAKVHRILLLALPALFLLLSLLVDLLLELFLFESSVFFFFGFLDLFFLLLLGLCLFLGSLLLFSLASEFRLTLLFFFFFESLLLLHSLLPHVLFKLLLHHLLCKHLRFFFSNLGSLLLCKDPSLLFGLLGENFLSLLFLSILQLLGQSRLGLGNGLGLLSLLLFNHLLLSLPLLLESLLSLLLSQLLLSKLFFPLLAGYFLMQFLELLLFVFLVSLGDGNLFGLFLKSNLGLFIQLSQFLGLILHFLSLLHDLSACCGLLCN